MVETVYQFQHAKESSSHQPVSYTHLDVYKRQDNGTTNVSMYTNALYTNEAESRTLRNLSISDMESNVDDEITTASSSSQSVVNVHM